MAGAGRRDPFPVGMRAKASKGHGAWRHERRRNDCPARQKGQASEASAKARRVLARGKRPRMEGALASGIFEGRGARGEPPGREARDPTAAVFCGGWEPVVRRSDRPGRGLLLGEAFKHVGRGIAGLPGVNVGA